MQNGDQPSKEKNEDLHHVDIVQKSIGVLGKWHIWICLAIFLVKFPVAWHQLSIVFVAPRTDFYCVDTTLDKCDPNCTAHVFNRWDFILCMFINQMVLLSFKPQSNNVINVYEAAYMYKRLIE